MTTRLFPVSLLVVLALSGCGQKGPATTGQPATEPASSSSPANASTSSGVRTIEITANDQMKFSLNSITAKPGEELHVVLTNAGSMAKEVMAHNWVLLKAGSDVIAFSGAAATARDTNYIPPALKDQVLAKIDLLGPHQTGEVTFKAPEQPGEYPFLCSFLGHAALMHGTLTVK